MVDTWEMVVLVEDATPDERTRFLGLLPAPVRLMYKAFGHRLYPRAMVTLRSS